VIKFDAIPEEDEEKNKTQIFSLTRNSRHSSKDFREANNFRDTKIILDKFNNLNYENFNEYGNDYYLNDLNDINESEKFNFTPTPEIIRDKSSESGLNNEASTSGSYRAPNKTKEKIFNFENVDVLINFNIPCEENFKQTACFSPEPRLRNEKSENYYKSEKNQIYENFENLNLDSTENRDNSAFTSRNSILTSRNYPIKKENPSPNRISNTKSNFSTGNKNPINMKLVKTPSINKIKIANEKKFSHSPNVSEDHITIPNGDKGITNLNNVSKLKPREKLNSAKEITPIKNSVSPISPFRAAPVNNSPSNKNNSMGLGVRFFSPKNEQPRKSYFNKKYGGVDSTNNPSTNFTKFSTPTTPNLPNILPPLTSRGQPTKIQFELNNIFNAAQNFKEDPEVKNKIDSLLKNIVDIKNVLLEKTKSRAYLVSAPTERKILKEISKKKIESEIKSLKRDKSKIAREGLLNTNCNANFNLFTNSVGQKNKIKK
jgi:hypothetical protein